MQDINNIILIGRLTKDCGADQYSFNYTKNGTAHAILSIAVNRSVKQNEQWQEEVSYFDIELWGKTAENLKPYLLKGTQIGVAGYLKQERWKDKDGNNKSKIVVVADNISLLGSKSNNSGSKPTTTTPQQQGYQEDIPF